MEGGCEKLVPIPQARQRWIDVERPPRVGNVVRLADQDADVGSRPLGVLEQGLPVFFDLEVGLPLEIQNQFWPAVRVA